MCPAWAAAGGARLLGQSANDGFDPNVNGPVHAIAVQSDGKIVIGGEFTSVGGITRSNIARLNVDGTLDTAFDPGTAVECLGCYQVVSALAIQADGRILVGGRFTVLGGIACTNIGRLNTNGTIDPSFVAGTDGDVLELAALSDGKILVAGAFFTLNGPTRAGIGRLNSNGSLDTNFNAGANETVNSLAVQPDGRIVVGGDFTMLGGQSRIGIGRLKADGSVDDSFNPPAIAEEMDALALQVDGKILVGGDFTMIGDVPRAGIGRLNTDGSVDGSFDPGMEGAGLHTLVVQPDGKILVGGFFTQLAGQACTNIGRLNPAGSLDASFHPTTDNGVNRFVVQADGSILVGGSFSTLGGTNRNHLGRLYSDGRLDKTLDANAATVRSHRLLGICNQPDGKIVICGDFITLDDQLRIMLARLNPDGSVDPSFDSPFRGEDNPIGVHAVLVQEDGKLVVGGLFSRVAGQSLRGICRLNGDGSLDPSFFNDFGSDSAANFLAAALQPDGYILIGGILSSLGGYQRQNIARMNSDGSVDVDFDPKADAAVRCFAIQDDDKSSSVECLRCSVDSREVALVA